MLARLPKKSQGICRSRRDDDQVARSLGYGSIRCAPGSIALDNALC